MKIDNTKLAASGAFLDERVENKLTTGRNSTDGTTSERVESTESAIIDDLEAQLNVEVDRIEEYFLFDTWPDEVALPNWVERFITLFEALSGSNGCSSTPEMFDDIPFVDILWPIVEVSDKQFVGGCDVELLTENGSRELKQALLKELVDCSAQALHLDFISFIGENESKLLEDDNRSPNSRKWYDAYVTSFFDGRMGPFFQEYSMIARLVVTVTEQWQASVTSFLMRLSEDFPAICSRLRVEKSDQVCGVTTLGDSHDDGNRVLLVKFTSGIELVYKPRSVEPERRFYEFKSWLRNELTGVPDLQAPNVLSRPTHGWVEKVEAAPHSSIDSIEGYYRSAGSLLCIAYVLNISDCHVENVIASERSPILVDVETIFELGASPARGTEPSITEELRHHVLNSTVLGTQLLPFGKGEDRFSGLGVHDDQESNLPKLSWLHVNTDAMDIEYITPQKSYRENRPSYDGERLSPREFVKEIIDGFESTYNGIVSEKVAVKQRISDAFRGVQTRTIIRDTKAYFRLLQTLTNPNFVRNGAQHGHKVQELLSRRTRLPGFEKSTKMNTLDIDQWDPIVAAERSAIQRRDVPRFTTFPDDTGLYFEGKRIVPSLTCKTGLERTRAKIDQLSEEDKRHQIGLIRACLESSNRRIAAHPGGYV